MEWRRDEWLVGDNRGMGAREQEEECVAAKDRRGNPIGDSYSMAHANTGSGAVVLSYSAVATGGTGTGAWISLLFLTTTSESVSTLI